MLEIEDIHFFYGQIHALQGVSMKVPLGKVVCLIGSNGAGKSTTLMSISAVNRISRGAIRFEGEAIHGLSPEQIVRRGISQVPEGRRIFPDLTVLENLEMGAFLRRDRGEVTQDLDHVYSLFPILFERRRQRGGTLSGGEQQMLAIGRALMTNPELLILDEATEGLAPLIRAEIWTCLEALKAQRLAILVIDKNLRALTRIGDWHYIMEKGRIAWSGDSAALAATPDLRLRYLGV